MENIVDEKKPLTHTKGLSCIALIILPIHLNAEFGFHFSFDMLGLCFLTAATTFLALRCAL